MTHHVSSFKDFQDAVAAINVDPTGDVHIVNLTEDIDFGTSDETLKFEKDTVILGNGYTINLGQPEKPNELSNSQLAVGGDATLTLGKEDGSDELIIKGGKSVRYKALIAISDGTLNMHPGVQLTGSHTRGATPGTAVNIIDGTFNMYGGEIHGNTTEGLSGFGAAVAGDGRYGRVVEFNMYGGSIRDNHALLLGQIGYGGGVFLINGTFHMEGGSITDNTVKNTGGVARAGLGGGVLLAGGEAVLSGGEITNNETFYYGGGLSVMGAQVEIGEDFKITGNKALEGGGIYNQGAVVVAKGAVIANNTAEDAGADIAHLDGSLTLADAEAMNASLNTGSSHRKITGWYLDGEPRWKPEEAEEVDVSQSLTKEIYLKAAYGAEYRVIYEFVSETEGRELPPEVMALLPVDGKSHTKGETVEATAPAETEVAVQGGRWTFLAYDALEKTIQGEITKFVGTWAFEAEPSKDDLPQTGGHWLLPGPHQEKPLEYHWGYLRGYEDGSFRPENSMTREEVATIFSRFLEGEGEGGKQPFADVPAGHWSAAAIARVREAGIIEGYPDGTFKPSQGISRAEFLAMAVRFQGIGDGEQTFVDVPESHWAYEIIKKGGTAGWIQGYPDGTFRPENEITRAEAVSILNRIQGRSPDENYIDSHPGEVTPYPDLSADHWAYYHIMEATHSHQYRRVEESGEENWKKIVEKTSAEWRSPRSTSN
ncbi:MAG: S-layer homology domain-containing protein [Tissierellia bacterium]|nr:S-layer homology domain-containing protein [Tissierellia bacterium]